MAHGVKMLGQVPAAPRQVGTFMALDEAPYLIKQARAGHRKHVVTNGQAVSVL